MTNIHRLNDYQGLNSGNPNANLPFISQISFSIYLQIRLINGKPKR